MAASEDLSRLVAALVAADPAERPDDAMRRAGLTAEDVVAACRRPDAVPALLSAAFAKYAVPILPGLVARLAERARKGDARAEEIILGFLGGKSPLREHLTLDPSTASDQNIKDMARQLIQQLVEVAK